MTIPDAFRKGDVDIDVLYDDAKFRFEKSTGKVYRRFYGEDDVEISPHSNLYTEANCVGQQIAPGAYFHD